MAQHNNFSVVCLVILARATEYSAGLLTEYMQSNQTEIPSVITKVDTNTDTFRPRNGTSAPITTCGYSVLGRLDMMKRKPELSLKTFNNIGLVRS